MGRPTGKERKATWRQTRRVVTTMLWMVRRKFVQDKALESSLGSGLYPIYIQRNSRSSAKS